LHLHGRFLVLLLEDLLDADLLLFVRARRQLQVLVDVAVPAGLLVADLLLRALDLGLDGVDRLLREVDLGVAPRRKVQVVVERAVSQGGEIGGVGRSDRVALGNRVLVSPWAW
jgi:hypothetical protein